MRRIMSGSIALAGLLVLIARPASAQNLATNGSFETGTFSGWNTSGDFTFNGVQCPGAGFVAQGSCDAFFGPVGTTGTLSQNISTSLGSLYSLSYFFKPGGDNPSLFSVSWGGATIFSVNNPAASAYTQSTFSNLVGQAGTTTLAFTFRDDPGFLFLDAVNVTSLSPEPATMMLMATGLVSLVGAGIRRRKRA